MNRSEAEEQIADLIVRSERADMNAERLDDADLEGQAATLRQEATRLREEAQTIAAEAGLGDLFDDEPEPEY